MRTVSSDRIKEAVSQAVKEIVCDGAENLRDTLLKTREYEREPRAKEVLDYLIANIETAQDKYLPLCQDTGMAVVFLEIGADVWVEGGLEGPVNEAVAGSYKEFRKSVVDPITRENTGDNTPAVLHITTGAGDRVRGMVMAKGFGSENVSRLAMLTPADGTAGIMDFVEETVKLAGSKGCPPYMIGVGIGGTMEKVAILAKSALGRPIGIWNRRSDIKELERALLERVNSLKIGPMGFGGNTTALWVAAEVFPTHIASLPVAVNLCCHAVRHAKFVV